MTDVLSATDAIMLLAAGALAGGVASLSMDFVMRRLPEGNTAPRVVAGVLTSQPPGTAPQRLATTIHHVAGVVSGALFVWLWLASRVIVKEMYAPILAAAILYVLLLAAFYAVLTQSEVTVNRVNRIRIDWAIASAAYIIVVGTLVVLGVEVRY